MLADAAGATVAAAGALPTAASATSIQPALSKTRASWMWETDPLHEARTSEVAAAMGTVLFAV
jgi:hypothetical protein